MRCGPSMRDLDVLFGDGSVRFISAFINPWTWVALSTRKDGDIPQGDY